MSTTITRLLVNKTQRTLIRLTERNVIDSESEDDSEGKRHRKVEKGVESQLGKRNTAGAIFALGRMKKVLMKLVQGDNLTKLDK
jgi:hypothetical protein